MKRSKRLVTGLVTLAVLLTGVAGLLFADKVIPVLGPVLPRPDGVPRQAAAAYDFKEGIVWRWRTATPQGCVRWMAMERWAVATFARGDEACTSKGRSLHYESFGGHLVFDWGRGKWSGGNPCPFSVAPAEIAAYLELVRDARKAAGTDKERAMLTHVERRLTNVDGEMLTTDHSGGCNDLREADYKGPARPHRDLWSSD